MGRPRSVCSPRWLPAPASWFPKNVACNSPARISNFEIGLLKFRGFLDT
ncbi:hypothetical protein HMPREF1980_02217 [Actinomyces sp. oral taxon 172 str. F0311]|nr:hypothetical protein HMPREF1980_02217 [Actinomyces sp. oral taxon 172 str. F0311]